MVYPAHALLRFGGRLFTTEQWSCGLRLITTNNSNTAQFWRDAQVAMLPDVVALVKSWFGRADSKITQWCRLDKVSLNAIGPDGKYFDPGSPNDHFEPIATAPSGPAVAATWPQLTTVVSLRTAVLRGRGTHGRVYTPTAIGASTTGLIPQADQTAMANSFKTLVDGINALPSYLVLAGLPRVGVVSSLGDPGPSRIVTRIMVGNVLDTQRRRRNQLVESYQTAVVA